MYIYVYYLCLFEVGWGSEGGSCPGGRIVNAPGARYLRDKSDSYVLPARWGRLSSGDHIVAVVFYSGAIYQDCGNISML